MNCLHPEHKNRKASSRGICKSCYVVACRLVKSGAVTWQQLEKAGKVRGKKGNELEQYYSEPKKPDGQKYPKGALVLFHGEKVKVASYAIGAGYWLVDPETGANKGSFVDECDLEFAE